MVTCFASLTGVPTLDAMLTVDYRFAQENFHWFLLAQEAGMPERLLSAAPDAFIDRVIAAMGAEDDSVIEPSARDAL